ncbi:MAG: hypothetical protein WC222_04855 [Parachlamydiales bacterium]|jgi:hypothetical protein
MQTPSLLPPELEKYCAVKDETSLFNGLKDNLPDLIKFFISSLDDHTWVDAHPTFFSKTIEVLTRRFFRQRILPETASIIAAAIRSQWKLLKENVINDLTVAFQGEEFQVNSLLFVSDSAFLRQIVLNECVDKDKKFFKLIDPPFDKEFFLTYLTYCQEGSLPDLWHKKAEELLSFMKMAVNCECKPLEQLAADTYKRYLDKKNVFESALFAYQCRWNCLFIVCADYANTLNSGITFLLEKPGLAVEVHNFLDDTLKIYNLLQNEISHLTCKGVLAEKQPLVDLVAASQYLYSLDLSDATDATYILQALFPKLENLNITLSEWLNASTLASVFIKAPGLTDLTLAKNTHLDYRAWGLFNKLKGLRSLNLSGCHQIRDADLSIILQGCSKLQVLNLTECNKLLDQGFYLIGRFVRNIQTLDLSRCLLTDAALVDIGFRCKVLQKLVLQQCPNISDKGIVEVVKRLQNLRELDLKGSSISQEVKIWISREYSYINLIDHG